MCMYASRSCVHSVIRLSRGGCTVELWGFTMVSVEASCNFCLNEALKGTKRARMYSIEYVYSRRYLVDRLGEQTGLNRQRCCRHSYHSHPAPDSFSSPAKDLLSAHTSYTRIWREQRDSSKRTGRCAGSRTPRTSSSQRPQGRIETLCFALL